MYCPGGVGTTHTRTGDFGGPCFLLQESQRLFLSKKKKYSHDSGVLGGIRYVKLGMCLRKVVSQTFVPKEV